MARDATDSAQTEACVAETARAFAGVSTLVNKVGRGRAHEDPPAVPAEAMIERDRLDARSGMRMTAACRPHLEQAANPTVTDSGSLVGVPPAFDVIACPAAKAAVERMMLGLTHCFARRLRVITIPIGTVITEGCAAAGLAGKTRQALMRPGTLTGRPGRPEDVANAFLWLASPAGGWVSGHTIRMAGGGKRMRPMPA